ncbi:MAG: 3-deoxy-7-phosphoheptulonate synthase [Bdellovibrionaceae bacterium]|nr:3-deoxy-7-phosphoheptulonate synthase [Pseudobdellovibrionaceae bacterium]
MSAQTRTVTVNFPSRDQQKNQGVRFGGREFVVIAGPCAIESREQFSAAAEGVKSAGAVLLRGGIHKMRTNPASFQGLGNDAFSFIKDVKNAVGLPFVSEVTDPRQISDLASIVDMFQVGSRNMYNYALLKELGQTKIPVLLKRGFSATVEEWLLAADYIVKGGNDNVVLCERGIRTFETTTRNTLDLNSVAYVKAHSSFPVIVDPSHGTGRPELIAPLAMAAAAVGADGIMVEVHPDPSRSLSDAHQALNFAQFADITRGLSSLLAAMGRELAHA